MYNKGGVTMSADERIFFSNNSYLISYLDIRSEAHSFIKSKIKIFVHIFIFNIQVTRQVVVYLPIVKTYLEYSEEDICPWKIILQKKTITTL